MSFVTRLSSSPRGRRVEVGQRQPVQLVLDVGAQRRDRALHDAVEQEALQVGQQPRRRRTPRRRAAARGRARRSRSRRPGTTSCDSISVAERVVAGGARVRGGLRRGGAGGQPPAEHAGEDQVGGVAEHHRPDDVSATLTTPRTSTASTPSRCGRQARRAAGGRTGRRSTPSPWAGRTPPTAGRHRPAALRGHRAGGLAVSSASAAWRSPGGRRCGRWCSCAPPPRRAGTRRSRRRSGTSPAARRACRSRRPCRRRARRSCRRS